MARRLVPLLLVLLLLGVACNAITGAGDLAEAKDTLAKRGDGGLSPDGAPWAVGADAGVDTSIPPASLASCGAGRICLPSVSGWTPTAHLATPGDCPAAYPTRADAVELTGGSCACSCEPAGGSCVGSLVVQLNGSCNGGDQTVDTGAGNGSCGASAPISIPAPPNISGRIQGAPTACNPNVTPSLTTAPHTTCSGAGPGDDQSCPRREICVPVADSGAKTCLMHDGDVPCPPNLEDRTVLGAADERACTGCACARGSCGTATIFTGASCSGSSHPLEVDGTCQAVGLGSVQSVAYTAGSGCQKTAEATVSGGLTAPKTVCCQSVVKAN